MRIEDPFHSGEIAVQERTGERGIAVRTGVMIADAIEAGAREFLAQQPMVICGSVGEDGSVWASVLFGLPGFAAADERNVAIDRTRTAPHTADPLWGNARQEGAVGLLFIDFLTRRRLRVNGTIGLLSEETLVVRVRETYPNCAKYIQRRRPSGINVAGRSKETRTYQGDKLSPDARAMTESADTMFVATFHPQRGVDASHRGGPPGFVKVLDETSLRIPDYSGNSMFNTLGNLAINPMAGVVFVEFTRGDLLQLTGRGELQFDTDDPGRETGGTNRFWGFRVERWLLSRGVAPLA